MLNDESETAKRGAYRRRRDSVQTNEERIEALRNKEMNKHLDKFIQDRMNGNYSQSSIMVTTTTIRFTRRKPEQLPSLHSIFLHHTAMLARKALSDMNKQRENDEGWGIEDEDKI